MNTVNVDNQQINFRLRYKIIILVTAILLTCTSIITYYNLNSGYLMRKKIAQDSVRHTATTIATIYVTSGDQENIQLKQVVDSLMNLENKKKRDANIGAELFFIFVKDRNGEPILANINYALSRKYNVVLKNNYGEQIENNNLRNKATIARLNKLIIPNLDRVVMPINVNGVYQGSVEIAYFARQFQAAEMKYLLVNILVMIILCVLGIVVAAYISVRITNPVLNVVGALKRLSEGDFQYRLKVSGNDEIIQLANGFNEMADSICRKREVIKKSEKRITLSERKYKVLFNNAGAGIMLLDNNKRCVEANERAEKILGWPTDMLKGAKLIDLIEPIVDKTYDDDTTWAGRVVIPGGDNCEVEVNITGINDGLFIAIFRDVKHWRDQQEKIVNLHKKQNKLIESIPHGIMTVDSSFTINVVNDTFEKMVCVRKRDFIGKKLSEIEDVFQGIDIKVIAGEVLNSGKLFRLSDMRIGKSSSRFELRVLRYTDDDTHGSNCILIMIDKSDNNKNMNGYDSATQSTDIGMQLKVNNGYSENEKKVIRIIGEDNDFISMMDELLSEESYKCESKNYGNITSDFFKVDAGWTNLIFVDSTAPPTAVRDVVDKIYEINPDVMIVICVDKDININAMEINQLKIFKILKKPFTSNDLRAILDNVFKR